MDAYVLILTEVGTGSKVGVAVGKVAGVSESHLVTGPYDVIARVEGKDMNALSKLVDEVQKIPGVTRTLTCPILRL
jgi:DNA-binding Lrp family transcriptional regulator